MTAQSDLADDCFLALLGLGVPLADADTARVLDFAFAWESPVANSARQWLATRGEAAVPGLLAHLRGDGYETRFIALAILAEIGPVAREALPTLGELLADPTYCQEAAGAIGAIAGSERAIELLLPVAFGDPTQPNHEAALNALTGDLAAAAVALVPELLERVRLDPALLGANRPEGRFLRRMAWRRSEVADALGRLLSSADSRLTVAILESVIEVGRSLATIRPYLSPLLDHESAPIRLLASRAIDASDHEPEIPF